MLASRSKENAAGEEEAGEIDLVDVQHRGGYVAGGWVLDSQSLHTGRHVE